MSNNKGFTLVELMVSIAMTGIIIAAIYSVYTLQQKTHTAQDQVVEMQQNIRAATLIMTQELRMAGYDPTSDANASFSDATAAGFSFEQDLNEDGDVDLNVPATDPNENIIYGFLAADDADGNGFVDNANGVAAFRRDNGGGLQPIAENIQAIEFLYTLEDGTETTLTTDYSNIRSITISILARTAWQDPKFVNNFVYTTASGDEWGLNGKTVAGTGVPFNDNFRRRLLITTIQCRNMGL